MRSSDAIYRDLESIEKKIKKYEDYISTLKYKQLDIDDRWRRAFDREKPRTKVKHIKSIAKATSINGMNLDFLAYTWVTTILHNEEELSFSSTSRPVVKNGKKVPGARRITESYDIITDKYPEIHGGSMIIKNEFLENLLSSVLPYELQEE